MGWKTLVNFTKDSGNHMDFMVKPLVKPYIGGKIWILPMHHGVMGSENWGLAINLWQF